MIDLLDYGFEETDVIETETSRIVDYEKNGYTIRMFDYIYEQANKIKVSKRTFTVNTKRYSSQSYSWDELEQWLATNNFKKEKE